MPRGVRVLVGAVEHMWAPARIFRLVSRFRSLAEIPDSEDRSTDTNCSRSGAKKLA